MSLCLCARIASLTIDTRVGQKTPQERLRDGKRSAEERFRKLERSCDELSSEVSGYRQDSEHQMEAMRRESELHQENLVPAIVFSFLLSAAAVVWCALFS